MKNMMRRTVAFMLMACLLLSVMAPAALAVTDNGDGSYTYTFAYDIASGNERPALSSEKFTGDFVAVARNNTNVKTSATTLQFQSAATTGNWYALKFNVETAGYYNIGFMLNTQSTTANGVDLHILAGNALAYEANNANNQTVIDGSTPIVSTELIKNTSQNPTVERVHFETAGDYLLIIEMTNDTNSVVNFTGFTMTDVSDEVAKEEAFRPALVEGSYVYTWAATADDRASNGYPTNYTGYFGNFAGHANSSSTMYKPYDGYMQIQSARTSGYIALRFNVPAAGTYNVSFDISGAAKILDVFFVDPANMATGNNVAANNTYVNGLTGGQRITVGTGVETLTKVTLNAGDYVMVWRLDAASPTGNVNFYGMTLTSWVAPPVAEVTTEYDFNLLDSALNMAEDTHYNFITEGQNETLQAEIDSGNLNYIPYAYYNGAFNSGSAYIENGYRGQGILHQGGPEGLIALKIVSPVAGTYKVTPTVSQILNGTTQFEVYFIPLADIEAKYEAEATGEDYTEGNAIHALIKSGAYTAAATGNARPNGVITPGTVTIAADTEYVAVFYAVTNRAGKTADQLTTESDYYNTAWLDAVGFTMTNNTYFATVDTAFAQTNSKFDTVKLLDNVDLDGAALNISTGAVLDLNGYSLDATVNVINGSLEDSSNGAGSVSDIINVTKDNGSVLIKDGDSVRAYNYTPKQNGYKANTKVDPADSEKTIDTIEFWFDADFASDAYAKLTSANGVTINAELKLNGKVVAIISLEEKVAQWVAQDGSEDYALGVEITGIETLKEGDTVTVTPIFSDGYGTSAVFGDAIVYTVPVAE